jgi:beta-aspartyl-peptidase (threonine type)
MERTRHCMLVGDGATDFAREQGFEIVEEHELIGHAASGPEHGTVGAVALDESGHIAAAVSTGGTADKMPGRVGDSPIIGCGALADDVTGGVVATGSGEHLLRIQMARTVWDRMRSGASPQQASGEGIRRLHDEVGGMGGVIALDARGRIGFAFNTTHLAVAFVDSEGKSDVRL